MYFVHLSLGNKLVPVSLTISCFNVSPMTFSEGKHEILPPGRNNPRHHDTTQANVSKAVKMALESWWTPSWPWTSIRPLQCRRPAASHAAQGSTASREREVILLFAQHQWHTEVRNAVSSAGLPSTRNTGTLWSKCSKRLQRWWRDWSFCHTRRYWELCLFSSGEEKAWGNTCLCVNVWWKKERRWSQAPLGSTQWQVKRQWAWIWQRGNSI